MLLVIPPAVFGLPLLFGWVFLDGDNFLQNFPMRVLVGRDLRAGMLPLWNPYLFSGTPLLAGFNAGAAYPPTWLTAILPIFSAWAFNLALAYDVAIAGMYLFLRRQSMGSAAATFGAATFAFAGFMTAQIVHIDLITGAAWLPWAVMAVHALTQPPNSGPPPSLWGRPSARRSRRWTALLALSVGLSILSGGVEVIIDGGVLIVLYGMGRLVTGGFLRRGHRRGLLSSAVLLLYGLAGGVALGGAQWIPGVAFASQSQRAGTTYSFFTSDSLPARLVTLLASPFVLGTNQGQASGYAGPYNFPEVTSYMGILALIAACSLLLRRYRSRPEARHWWVWYVILAVGLISALGGQTPFGHLMYLIPGIMSERLLNRNLLLVDFSLAVLLGWWVHLLLLDRKAGGPPVTAAAHRRRPGGRRIEVMVTCVPLAVIAVLGLLLWVDGSQLEHLLQIQFAVSAASRQQLAILVTAGAVIAAAATWIVLCENRFSPRRLRRLLATVLAVDLVLFNLLVIRPPTTEAKAQALGPASTVFRNQVGDGRFIIYDPDEFHTDDLYALGQTDLNLFRGLSSGQGYTALTDGRYYDATGAHYQEDLDPATLAGATWDELNVTTLLSLPGYFVTPVRSPTGDPGPGGSVQFPADLDQYNSSPTPVPDSFTLTAGQPRGWYFGGVLSVEALRVPVLGDPPADLRIGLVTPTGGTQWLPPPDATLVGTAGHRAFEVVLPSAVRAGGLLVEAAAPTRPTVGTPMARTAEAGEVALNGRMQYGVVPPHWTFTGTLGSFGVFHNHQAEGWARVRAPGGGAAAAGSSVTAVAPGPDGSQRMMVHATSAAVLERSEAWSPGWRATLQSVLPGSDESNLGPPHGVVVQGGGVVQRVDVPGPGDFVVTFTYAATPAVAGLVVSAVAAGGLVLWGIVELIAAGRRRRLGGGTADPRRALSPD